MGIAIADFACTQVLTKTSGGLDRASDAALRPRS